MKKHELIKLPYEYNSLEPFIDAKTMEIHHSKHHQGYVNKLNASLESHPELFEKPLEELLKNIETLPNDIKQSVINNGGGVYNHNLFFNGLSKEGDKKPWGGIGECIEKTFGGFEKFKEEFTNQALNLFGSGWVWLAQNKNSDLGIYVTNNQDSIISVGKKPLLNLDVWEHAYYLKYQNKRNEYIENWWDVINWDMAEYYFGSESSSS